MRSEGTTVVHTCRRGPSALRTQRLTVSYVLHESTVYYLFSNSPVSSGSKYCVYRTDEVPLVGGDSYQLARRFVCRAKRPWVDSGGDARP